MKIEIRKFRHGIVMSFLLLLLNCNAGLDGMLAISRDSFSFESDGGSATFILQTDAPSWRIQNPADWIHLDQTNGTESSATITISIDSKSIEPRSEVITIITETAEPVDITISQEAADFLYALKSNFVSLQFKKGGNSKTIEVITEAPEWSIGSSADWLSFSPSNGGSGTTDVSITATANLSSEPRADSIFLSADYAQTYGIAADQIGEYYPSYNTDPLPADDTGMSSTAVEIAAKIKLGINIGNTLEAMGGETAWGNPQISADLIKTMKQLGFESIRLPASWDQYADQKTGEIDQSWLDRVKTVVQYCIDNDLYVILNVHWDGGWLENNVTPDAAEHNNAKQKAYWEQIATHLRDFDERLIFAGTNEPNVENESGMAVLMSYHQTFIDAVRSTGGKNSHRVLVFQGPSTDIDKTAELMNIIPTDIVDNKLMAEVHYYSPYQFCLMEEDASWGKVFYYWGENNHSTENPSRNADWGEEGYMEAQFARMQSQFVHKGIPVILGEFGAYKRQNIPEQEFHDRSVEYFNKYVVQTSIANGLLPYYWDTGGMIDRHTGTIKDQGLLNALKSGVHID
ncbi:MAG: cellulase family glycosylhydrolase [Cyclobacteriaceae bacterium]